MPVISVDGTTKYTSGTTAKTGEQNAYPPHECTWWANERYHELTGYYVSWAADAHGWLAGAQASGWEWSALPPDVPSIIVLQPGVQGADIHYGHVGVVEKVNRDGSVTTSDLNWGPDVAARSVVSAAVFHTGPGVDFVWVGGATQTGGSPVNTGTAVLGVLSAVQGRLNPDASVAQTLQALDFALEVHNPFDTSGPTFSAYDQALNQQIKDTYGISPNITILGQDTGVQNPFIWLNDVAANVAHDISAVLVRGLFIFAGAAILIKVSAAFIDYGAIAETAASGAKSLAGLAALA